MENQTQQTQPQSEQKKKWHIKRWWLVVFTTAMLAFLIVMIIVSVHSDSQEKEAEKKEQAVIADQSIKEQEKKAEEKRIKEEAEKAEQQKKEEERQFNYEIIEKREQGSVLVLKIYTTEDSDNDIIALNDKLLDIYKSGHTHIFITYFNDKKNITDSIIAKMLDFTALFTFLQDKSN